MSHRHVEVRTGAYADSVTLLQVGRRVQQSSGVEAAQVAMATPLNLDLLAQMGFRAPVTTINDMVVAIRVSEEEQLAEALAAVDQALDDLSHGRTGSGVAEDAPPRTTYSALCDGAEGVGLALVSVPGENAVVEAVDALEAGHDVMIFSDNVPVEHEIALKDLASGRGLLVMGPDCGTAVLGGVGLGFANTCSPGPLGIVAASGTGCQQLMCLLEYAGVGVGTALGVGGRDLSADVGARSTLQALRRLDADPDVHLIVVVSKPPAEEVAMKVRAAAEELDTPVVIALLGEGRPDLTEAVGTVLVALDRPTPDWPVWGDPLRVAAPTGDLLRGLFVGGTLCDEAMLIVTAALGPVRSNIPTSPELGLGADLTAPQHQLIDFGDDSLTAGRAHPMIDPTLRLEHLARSASDERTGVLLLDVVLGHGAEPDPAELLAPAVVSALATARSGDRELAVLISCIGTDLDPQGLSRQASALAQAGAEVYLSNAEAARRAVALLAGAR